MSLLKVLGNIAGPILKTVAPTVATALGGPLAGMATGWLAKKLLGNDTAKLEDIAKFINSANNPETMLKLKEMDQEFKLEMDRMGIDVFALEVQDRSSAREFGIKTKIGAWLQAVIAVVTVVGFIVSAFFIFTGNVTTTDPNMLMLIGTVFGALATQVTQVYSFLFGSSHGSSEKNDQFAKVMQNSVNKS